MDIEKLVKDYKHEWRCIADIRKTAYDLAASGELQEAYMLMQMAEKAVRALSVQQKEELLLAQQQAGTVEEKQEIRLIIEHMEAVAKDAVKKDDGNMELPL